MTLRLRTLLAGVLLASPAALAHAWSDAWHESVAQQSARLMPASLHAMLADHVGRLNEGARAPLSRTLARNQSIDEAILDQSQRVLDLLRDRAPFSMLAYELGVLSHLVSVAEDPTSGAASDPREDQWRPRFHAFAESRIPRYRVVFDGYLSEPLSRDDVPGFARHVLTRSARHYPLLSRSYVRENGQIATNASFDDRHPVYGIASLAYSRSIADTAKLWFYLWLRAGGDTTELPFPQGLSQPTLVGRRPAR